VILFRIGQDALEIVRVLHSAMDFKRHLPPNWDRETPGL
jgi:plasmid stabilization system protein ParE